MIVDPAVSKRKFDREVALARSQRHWQLQGVWILRAEFPIVFVALVSPKMLPLYQGVMAAVHIDFSDFDVQPPSIRFVDPHTEAPLSFGEIKWHFPKATKVARDPTSGKTSVLEQVTYVQSFDGHKPFLCLPGVREYHQCSAHSGDSWFMHRKPQGGLLVHLLSTLHRYGPGSLQGLHYNISVVPQPIASAPE
jgi:hypothetical protein